MKKPKTSEDKVAVKLSSNKKASGQVCGVPISLKVDTGAKKTFISLKAYKSILHTGTDPVLSQQSNSLSQLMVVFRSVKVKY